MKPLVYSQEHSNAKSANLSGSGMVDLCNIEHKYVSICNNRGFGIEPTLSDPITYKGTVCQEELNLLKNCLLNESDESNRPLVVTDDSLEDAKSALSAVDMLDELISDECAVEVKPFLCLYFFGLHDAANGVSYQPSASHCKSLRDDVCALEWNLAKAVPGLELPDCDEQFASYSVPCDEERGKELIDCDRIQAHAI